MYQSSCHLYRLLCSCFPRDNDAELHGKRLCSYKSDIHTIYHADVALQPTQHTQRSGKPMCKLCRHLPPLAKHIHILHTTLPPLTTRTTHTTLIISTSSALDTILEPRVPPIYSHPPSPQPHIPRPYTSIAITLALSHSITFFSPLISHTNNITQNSTRNSHRNHRPPHRVPRQSHR